MSWKRSTQRFDYYTLHTRNNHQHNNSDWQKYVLFGVSFAGESFLVKFGLSVNNFSHDS